MTTNLVPSSLETDRVLEDSQQSFAMLIAAVIMYLMLEMMEGEL